MQNQNLHPSSMLSTSLLTQRRSNLLLTWDCFVALVSKNTRPAAPRNDTIAIQTPNLLYPPIPLFLYQPAAQNGCSPRSFSYLLASRPGPPGAVNEKGSR